MAGQGLLKVEQAPKNCVCACVCMCVWVFEQEKNKNKKFEGIS